jgi:hypothetical protein
MEQSSIILPTMNCSSPIEYSKLLLPSNQFCALCGYTKPSISSVIASDLSSLLSAGTRQARRRKSLRHEGSSNLLCFSYGVLRKEPQGLRTTNYILSSLPAAPARTSAHYLLFPYVSVPLNSSQPSMLKSFFRIQSCSLVLSVLLLS